MMEKLKSPIALFIVLIAVSVSLAGGVFYLLQKERAKNLALQEELEDIKTRQRITETKLQESQKVISTLELKLGEAKIQMDTLTSDLEGEKSAKLEALAKIEQLRVELDQQKNLRSDLEKKFSQAQKEMGKIQAQLNDLESKKTELETKLKDLEEKSQGVELGKIVVSPDAPVPAQKSLKPAAEKSQKKTAADTEKKASQEAITEGKVLVVNKEYNFAVINLGSQDGVGIGDVFSVYHAHKYTGDIKVEKVHDSMSAAGFVSSGIKDKVSEGDRVVLKSQ